MHEFSLQFVLFSNASCVGNKRVDYLNKLQFMLLYAYNFFVCSCYRWSGRLPSWNWLSIPMSLAYLMCMKIKNTCKSSHDININSNKKTRRKFSSPFCCKRWNSNKMKVQVHLNKERVLERKWKFYWFTYFCIVCLYIRVLFDSPGTSFWSMSLVASSLTTLLKRDDWHPKKLVDSFAKLSLP